MSASPPPSVREPDFDDLYRDVVFEHYREPNGRDALARDDVKVEGFNPLCGDEVDVAVQMENGLISGVQILGRGCAISVASGSILHDLIEGETPDEARRVLSAVREVMHGGEMPDPDSIDLGDFDALEGVKRFPVRIKCALLPWTTLEQALRQFDEMTTERGAV